MAQPTGGGSGRRGPSAPPITGAHPHPPPTHTHEILPYHWHDKQVLISSCVLKSTPNF